MGKCGARRICSRSRHGQPSRSAARPARNCACIGAACDARASASCQFRSVVRDKLSQRVALAVPSTAAPDAGAGALLLDRCSAGVCFDSTWNFLRSAPVGCWRLHLFSWRLFWWGVSQPGVFHPPPHSRSGDAQGWWRSFPVLSAPATLPGLLLVAKSVSGHFFLLFGF